MESQVAKEVLKPLEEYAQLEIVPCNEEMNMDEYTAYKVATG